MNNTKPFIRRGHIATVQNDVVGKTFIASLRATLKTIKKDTPNFTYRVRVYGRGHRYGKGRIHGYYRNGTFIPTNRDNSYQSCLPHHLAERLAIYVS